MLGRVAPGVCQVVAVVNHQPNRNMATLKAISIRLKSVKNIQKITQSMKMVSAAKYTRAERELKAARPYGEGSILFYERAEVAPPEDDPKQLYVAITSDRAIPRLTTPNSRSFARRCARRRCRGEGGSYCEVIGRLPPTFSDAAKLAEAILTSGYEFGSGKIVYNKFRSVVSYQQSDLPLYSQKAVQGAPKLATYDSLDSDVIQSYMEFSLASMLFYAMKEGACSEQSSRMTAMDNASKNAGEMIDKLTLTFNRTRQAVITRELIEIISGAAALD
ncbi:hypothetical protein K1T71_012741 [Dendrolimus kikuchii]|uniref:Uncharacterized protein n=1 Tax=Dendrolimus kikuchii TaxID=765133 RepID=A0ACC1CK57_9NEOP|nr:hypothetical protein K1T71_012741 [Dendrolimus kikuchii]